MIFRRKPELIVTHRAMEDMLHSSAAAWPMETGGILVGWRTGPAAVLVADALTINDQDAGDTDYRRTHRRAETRLADYRSTSQDPRIGYVGEWHSHPKSFPPSRLDIESLRAIVENSSGAVAMIVAALDSDATTWHGRIGYRHKQTRRVRIRTADVEQINEGLP